MQSKTKLVLLDEQCSGALLCLAMGDWFSSWIAGVLSHCKSQIFTHLYKQMLCKQQRWIKDIILHFLSFLRVLLPLQFDCTNIWEQWKRSRCVNAKWEHTAIKFIWILANCTFLAMKRCEMGEETSKTTCRSETKNWVRTRHFSQRCPVVNLWQRHSPVAGSQMEKGKLPRGSQLQAAGTEKWSYLCRPQWRQQDWHLYQMWHQHDRQSSSYTQTLCRWMCPGTLQPSDCPWIWAISSLGPSRGGTEALAEGLCSGLPRAVCSSALCTCVCLSTWCGHNVFTNPQILGRGGMCFHQVFPRGKVGWKFSWQGSSSCHLNIPFQLNCIFNNPSDY